MLFTKIFRQEKTFLLWIFWNACKKNQIFGKKIFFHSIPLENISRIKTIRNIFYSQYFETNLPFLLLTSGVLRQLPVLAMLADTSCYFISLLRSSNRIGVYLTIATSLWFCSLHCSCCDSNSNAGGSLELMVVFSQSGFHFS